MSNIVEFPDLAPAEGYSETEIDALHAKAFRPAQCSPQIPDSPAGFLESGKGRCIARAQVRASDSKYSSVQCRTPPWGPPELRRLGREFLQELLTATRSIDRP
jgi:hypothetical protein